MILLNDVIQILTLSNFDALVLIAIVLLDAGRVGAAFIDIDQTRLTIGADGFV